MIKIVNGNLLEAKEHIVGHQVNCQGVMGSGVAKQIKAKHPDVFDCYRQLVEEKDSLGINRASLLGEVQGVWVSDENGGKWVANLFGQEKYGTDGKVYTRTTALYECFKKLRKYAEEKNLSVALPYMIGCYRGGADWKEVESLLLKAFEGYEVTLYKYHEG